MAEMPERAGSCPERERLLSEWTDSSRRTTKLLDEQLAAIRNADPAFGSFAEKIQLAKNEELDACRAYYGHVDGHGCV
jgi:hypothetical protein